jgi:hypothetical protein
MFPIVYWLYSPVAADSSERAQKKDSGQATGSSQSSGASPTTDLRELFKSGKIAGGERRRVNALPPVPPSFRGLERPPLDRAIPKEDISCTQEQGHSTQVTGFVGFWP